MEKLLLLFTRLPADEIKALLADDIIRAKQVMAHEITALVHGQEAADQAAETARSLFQSGTAGENAPESDFLIPGDSIGVVELFCSSGFAASRSEVRRLIQQNGVYVDGKKCETVDAVISRPPDKDYVLLRKGKKNYLKVRFV